MKRLLFALLILVCWSTHAVGAIIGEPVMYKAGDLAMQGYLAYDDTIADKRPGILLVHEWWGHNEYARAYSLWPHHSCTTRIPGLLSAILSS